MVAFARLVFLAALAAFFLPAFALAPGNIAYPGGNRGTLIPNPVNSANVAGRVIERASQNAKVVDEWIGRVGGKDVPLKTSRIATAANIARGIAAATGIGALAIGLQIASEYRCKPDSSGDWSCDKGQAKEPRIVWKCDGKSADTASGAYSSCVQAAHSLLKGSWLNGAPASDSRAIRLEGTPSCVGETCHGMQSVLTLYGGAVTHSTVVHTKTVQQVRDLACPPGSSEFDGGKCSQTEDKWVPESDTDVAAKVEPLVSSDPAEALRDVLRTGQTVETGPLAITGPQKVVQEPVVKTVTSPTGQPQTTTTSTTNNMTYLGDSFTWYNTTNITYPDGTVEDKSDPVPEEKSPCERDPSSANCADRDTPDSGEIEKKEIPISYSPDSGWAEAGACPPDVQLSLLGQGFSIEYTPTCNFLVGMRPFVIATAAIVALLIFVGGLKE
jgi:hypothetical protein